MKFVHTNIISANWKSLADFYVSTFECAILPPVRKQFGTWLDRGLGLPGAHLEGAHLRLPGYGEMGPTLEIFQYSELQNSERKSPNHTGFGHIAFEVDNVAHTRDLVVLNGGTAQGEIAETQIEGIGRLTFVYVRDPDGNLIELQHWDRPANV